MNICFLCTRYPGYGGIENVTTVLANYLTSKHNIFITSLMEQDKDVLLKKLYKGIIVKHVDEKIFIKFLQDNKIDVIIFQDSFCEETYNLAELAYKKLKIRIISVCHNTPNAFLKLLRFNTFHIQQICLKNILKVILYPYRKFNCKKNISIWQKKIINISYKYITFTDEFKNQIIKITHCSENKIVVINNPNIYDSIPFIQRKEKKVLFVGRFDEQKGIFLLLKIWKKIQYKIPDWKLILVGDGELKKKIEKYINKNHLQSISLVGYKQNCSEYYEKASILCMTSIFEGWGLVLCEAMSYSLVPFLFESYSAAKIITDNGNAGILIKPFKINKYANNLVSIIENDVKLEKYRKNAHSFVSNFDISKIGLQYQKLIESIK